MDTLAVQLGSRSYPIHIGPGLLDDPELIRAAAAAQQIFVVTDTTVAPLYLDKLRGAFRVAEVRVEILPDGEQYKTLASFSAIMDTLVDAGFHRDACIVALGGGVIGDIAGFCAACYQRGIRYVQIPTTLLAQVDSSVGGKTAVNHSRAKNMIGAFYQPAAVIADTDTLATLPPRQFAAGLAEVIKYGLILDAEFFTWLEARVDDVLAHDSDALRHIIRRSCELKAAIVAEDEREHGRRALLNLGHTFGHALEALGRYDRWLHGEAVAVGMLLAVQTSVALGRLEPGAAERLERLLQRVKLPTRPSAVSSHELVARMQLDKKASAGGLQLVLLDGIGNGVIVPSPGNDFLCGVVDRGLVE